MVCTVPISQNVAIHQLLLISVYIFACARSSESTREFVMKYFCWLSFLEFEECSIFLIEIWSIEIFSISSYTKLQSIILRSFECNLIPGTSYRSDKWIHFSSNQFMNGILTWFGCNFPSETRNYSERSLSQHFLVYEIWCTSLNIFSLLLAQNKVNELVPVNSLLFVAFK